MKGAVHSGLFLCLLVVSAAAFGAQPQFPKLSGRVVDQAGLLSPAAKSEITHKLAAHEKATGQQVVVVTLKKLDGLPIDQYGYQLGRHWGIGQKGKDTGALLIVAPKQRKVRIEVGYGLEGTLTDAISSNIIRQVILPKFRKDHVEAGIVAGTNAILSALGGHYKKRGKERSGRDRSFGGILMLIMLAMGFLPMLFGGLGRRGLGRGGLGNGIILGGMMGGGFGGGLGGGGGFSGGGGSFGGGGASGGW